jgi:hypothetical protein
LLGGKSMTDAELIGVFRIALRKIREEADVMAHEEPDQWGAIHKLDRIWETANVVLELAGEPLTIPYP